MRARGKKNDHGGAVLEYCTVIALVAAVAATLLTVLPSVSDTVASQMREAVERIFGDGETEEGGAPGEDLASSTEDGPEDGAAGGEDDGEQGPPVGGEASGQGEQRGLGEHTLDYFGAAGEGILRDLEGLWNTVSDPAGTAQSMWEGFTTYLDESTTRVDESVLEAGRHWQDGSYWEAIWEVGSTVAREQLWESPFGPGGVVRSVVDDEVIAYAEDGDYGSMLGLASWNLGQWFIPYAGWGNRALNVLPDAPSTPRNDPGGQQRADEQHSQDSAAGRACSRTNSFPPGTLVVMADGGHTPIEEITIGEEVWAADPHTGEAGAREVTATITDSGLKTLVDITVTDGSGGTDTLTATDNHPFWVPHPGEWTPASELTPGSWLHTAAGTWIHISAVEAGATHPTTVHNLTIADLHTYHVVAGDNEVLVHNDSSCTPMERAQEIGRETAELPRGQRLNNIADSVTDMDVSQTQAARLVDEASRYAFGATGGTMRKGENEVVLPQDPAVGAWFEVTPSGRVVPMRGRIEITSEGEINLIPRE
jgi:hypothetical protein